jgi:hypothetical protein
MGGRNSFPALNEIKSWTYSTLIVPAYTRSYERERMLYMKLGSEREIGQFPLARIPHWSDETENSTQNPTEI